ncbi:MAG TPA: CocE/NonD family hydrolase [Thermoguttaceae bacterium]|nr:CocE/NonD family hydrolase [Thermoguttaceae bacterium]
MPRRLTVLILGMLATASIVLSDGSRAAEQGSEAVYSVKHEVKVPVPMRDGVKLAAEIYRPDAPGEFPALMLLRYFRGGHQNARGEFFAQRGYAVALVDCRGRYDSEGTWTPYVNDPQDGYDAQQWLGSQPWCDGKLGTFGLSYNAFTSYMAAPLGSPHLKCIFARSGQQTNFGHLYNDGVMQLNVIFEFGLHTKQGSQTQRIFPVDHPHYRRLPLIDAVDDFAGVQHVKDWFRHARYDDYWKAYGIKEKYPRITAPAYFITGWYDNLLRENWRNFSGFREQGGSEAARNGSKILVGNWAHGGSSGYPGLLDLQLRWYDHWLKGIENGIDREPPIKIYVMGRDEWRDENEWPLARTQFTRFYLHGEGHANSVRGDGTLAATPCPEDSPPDRFVYDPENPVYTLGGQISTHGDVRGAKDRRSVQERDDVLVYSTEPLAEDLEVTGPVELELHFASSAVDTDFTATLSDVHPDGTAIHICEGIRGVTFRESLEEPTPIEPGKIYRLTINLWETSMVFKAGHRIRLEVSSSNFPRYARNQNTGLPLGTSALVEKAQQTVYHDARRASCLILPVIPGEGNR